MYRMIIGDDEKIIQESLMKFVDWKSLGFEVVALVEDGKDAIEILKRSDIDVVFCDIMMQEISGLEVAKHIHDNHLDCEIVLLMIEELSVMLREVMSIENNLISIEDEVRYTKAYIDILDRRYNGKLKVVWSYPEEVLPLQTMKFILQPMVENSVKHGYKNMKTPGEIYISIERDGENVIYTVSDDGIGTDADWIERMNRELSNSNLIGNHIGLKNVDQRLKLLFGEAYGVKICPSEKGFAVQIAIPCIE